MNSLIDECYNQSIGQLLQNSTEFGLLAAAPKSLEGETKTYTALYSRDIGISSLGLISSGNDELIKLAKQSLITLTKAQSTLGQFPFYYHPEENRTQWRNPGSIDSTLWWAIAFLHYYKKTSDTSFYETYKTHLEKAFTWLTYQDTNHDNLLEQGEAADWADEMPRSGMVLYTNVLWHYLLSLRIAVERRSDLTSHKDNIFEACDTLFWIHKLKDRNTSYIPDNAYTRDNVFAKGLIEYINSHAVYLPYYVGYVGHKLFELRCDMLGNILACLTGLADEKKSEMIVDFIFRSGANTPYPVRSLFPPIFPGEQDWRDYMAKGRQNYPFQYHNGGIWPFIGAFWVMLLDKLGHPRAQTELANVAQANSLNDWEFNEYLHGQHGTPMGVPHQSWNMAMFLAAKNNFVL